MATHSSILAWRSPWIEELGSLQSMGSQRAGHDWATNTLNCFSNTGQWVYAIQDGPHLLLVGTAICFGKMWVYPKNLNTSPFYSFLLSSSKQYLAQGQCPVIFFDRWIFRHLNKSTLSWSDLTSRRCCGPQCSELVTAEDYSWDLYKTSCMCCMSQTPSSFHSTGTSYR